MATSVRQCPQQGQKAAASLDVSHSPSLVLASLCFEVAQLKAQATEQEVVVVAARALLN